MNIYLYVENKGCVLFENPSENEFIKRSIGEGDKIINGCNWKFVGYEDMKETISRYYIECINDERPKYDNGKYCTHCGKLIKEE